MSNNNSTRVLLTEIPDYLHSSHLYQNFDFSFDNDNDESQRLEIPTNVMKDSSEVFDVKDLRYLLRTLQYWASEDLPYPLLDYCAQIFDPATELIKCPDILVDKETQVAVMNELASSSVYLPNVRMLMEVFCKKAISDADCIDSFSVINTVSISKHNQIARYLVRAIKLGCHNILGYLLDRMSKSSYDYFRVNGTDMDYRCCFIYCRMAAANGNVLCLDLLHRYGFAWNRSTCSTAAAHGHISCLKYAHEHGCEWDPCTCFRAAEGGHLQCLQYAYTNGCGWDYSTCEAAVIADHLECLQYAVEHGCNNNMKNLIEWAVKLGNLKCLKYLQQFSMLDDVLCKLAIENKRFDTLLYLLKHGCRCVGDICKVTAQFGELECLKYVHHAGYVWDSNVCAKAALYGQLDTLRYAHENGCPWDNETCNQAAKSCNLACLQYAHQNGCPWDASTFRFAIRAVLKEGDEQCMDMIRYMHVQNCPWDARCCEEAIKCGFLAALRFLHENNCPWDEQCLRSPIQFHVWRADRMECVRYALNNGCPCSEEIRIPDDGIPQLQDLFGDFATDF